MAIYNQKKGQGQKSYSLPVDQTVPEFGKVNVIDTGNHLQIEFTILFEPSGREAEGWLTGIALDGSSSMKDWYGQRLLGTLPDDVMKKYKKKKWIEELVQDGRTVKSFKREAYEDAIKAGYLTLSKNIVEPEARKFIGYLAGNLDAGGKPTLVYWACGDGRAIEELGQYNETQCQTLDIKGPKDFGSDSTILTPALTYFTNKFKNAKRGMFIFITDGKLDDLDDVKRFTVKLAKEIENGRRGSLKFVLIGVGDDVDESQMEELDDLDTDTDIDIWDHKIAHEMRAVTDIFSEVVNDNQIVAPTGHIYSSSGNLVKKYTDGLPARVEFTMPAGSKWFELDVNGRRIRQEVT
jgi:hypothetical protein